jgi:endonuclease I
VWGALDFTDEDPANADNVILLYTGRSHPKPDKVSSVLIPDHDNDSWNREHVWPRSHGVPSEGQLAHSDIHHLRPADVTCNADRGNLDFDESDVAHPECASRRDADSFEPRDAVKGDVARMLFYMDVRYAGADGVPDLTLIDEDSNSGPLLGHLCTLLVWHEADPVHDPERRRHQRICGRAGQPQSVIDGPEFVAAMWSSACALLIGIGLRPIRGSFAHANVERWDANSNLKGRSASCWRFPPRRCTPPDVGLQLTDGKS